jgi:archaellum component FlaC
MDPDTVTLELLGRQLQRVLDRMNAFEQNIPLQLKAMDARLDQMNAQFKLFDARFDQQDLKFQRIEESLDAIANRLLQAIVDLKTTPP